MKTLVMGPNLQLKFLLLQKYGSQVNAARSFRMSEKRLSQVIHRRAKPTPEERRTIAWSLQLPADHIFDGEHAG